MQGTQKTLTLQRKAFEGPGLGVLPDHLWVRPGNAPAWRFSPPLSLPTGRNMGVGARREGRCALTSQMPRWKAGLGLCCPVLQQV